MSYPSVCDRQERNSVCCSGDTRQSGTLCKSLAVVYHKRQSVLCAVSSTVSVYRGIDVAIKVLLVELFWS